MLIYTTASSGTVLSLHYCMGDLAGVSVGEKISSQCGKCGMKDKDCCHDEPVVIKIENAAAQQPDKVSLDFTAPLPPQPQKAIVPVEAKKLAPFVERFIVPEGRPPVYLMHCVFRI